MGKLYNTLTQITRKSDGSLTQTYMKIHAHKHTYTQIYTHDIYIYTVYIQIYTYANM